ncbi:hypothetical protein IC757_11205 [Wenzhouxiangella sp. AB-CW3]|uniref:outer membrane protein n=1 Tax=Wenzhouxiangella sp. AB-CW3 TaxID=2771012 RepID=UPI00168ABAB9|nr:hypothetical protein [Wenzhouxiangella sp. AB-CW3]QOC21607.1 hypothetical protein IC757_11205 [Wenzhouxiangella sp. AB-CW3]
MGAMLLPVLAQLSVVISLMMAIPSTVMAKDSEPSLSASLMTGYRDGGRFQLPGSGDRSSLDGDLSHALVLAYEVEPGNFWELFFSQQRTSLPAAGVDVNVSYLHLGGRLEFSGHRVVPYVAGGVGATRISARGIDVGSELRPSVSVAGGLEWPLTQHFALRMEGRAHLTTGSGNRGLLCVSGRDDAFCQLAWSGDVMGQAEVLGGITVRF